MGDEKMVDSGVVVEVREVYGSTENVCGRCRHFVLTNDPIGECGIPLPGLVNKIWVISKTSKMRCKLYDRSETASDQGSRDDSPFSGDWA